VAALAWACLEVEMNPDNVAAVALKERLKREAGFLRRQGSEKHRPAGDDKPLRTAWGGVAGMRDPKAMLERDVILPLQEPEIYAHYRLNLPNGILLYEPPGYGKTFIARKLAAVAGFSFIEVKPGDLASIYVHGIQGKIAELFAEARKQVPCMIFFDELDAMVPSRSGDRSSGGSWTYRSVFRKRRRSRRSSFHSAEVHAAPAFANSTGQPNCASMPMASASPMRASKLSSVQPFIGGAATARSGSQVMQQADVPFGIEDRSMPRVFTAAAF